MPRPFPPRPRRQRPNLRTAIRSRRARPRRPTRRRNAPRRLDAPLFPPRPSNFHVGHATPRRRRPRKKLARRSRGRMESEILEFAIRNFVRPPRSPRASHSRQRSRATPIPLRSNGPRRPQAKPRNRARSRIRRRNASNCRPANSKSLAAPAANSNRALCRRRSSLHARPRRPGSPFSGIRGHRFAGHPRFLSSLHRRRPFLHHHRKSKRSPQQNFRMGKEIRRYPERTRTAAAFISGITLPRRRQRHASRRSHRRQPPRRG